MQQKTLRNKIAITAVLLAVTLFSIAQQDPQFSQNMFNKLSTNAGYAGTNKGICATAIFRQQWASFPGAPKTGLFSVDAFVKKIKGGVGLTLISDQLGYEKTNFAKVAYSYHLNLPTGGVLGIGADLGVLQKSIDGKWIAPDGTDGKSDKSIPQGGNSKAIYDIGLGLFYTDAKMYAGISSTHLPQQDLTSLSYIVSRTYYFTAGYDYPVTPTIDLKPSIFVKSVASPTQMDINMLVQWDKKVYGGVSYRLTDAVVALVGYNHTLSNGSNLRIGYAYDFTTSALKVQSKGSHEILLNYCFRIQTPPKRQSHGNVRFMR